jgi:hypothetical protein
MVEDSLRKEYGGHLDKARTKYKLMKITTYGKIKIYNTFLKLW